MADHDTVVCVTVFMLPIFPLHACHVFDSTGNVCREVPLRKSRELLLRAFLRPWLFFFIGAGILATVPFGILLYAFVTSTLPKSSMPGAAILICMFAMLLPLSLALQSWLNRVDRRNRDIRLIMGPHALGSSDPVRWASEVLASFTLQRSATELLKDAREALREGKFSNAMTWARVAIARGAEFEGEAMTDQVLNDPRIQEFLDALRKEPWRRSEWIPTATASASKKAAGLTTSTPEAGDEVSFYDGHRYARPTLDEVGGAGYADFVAANPSLRCPAPAPLVTQIVKLGFALSGLAVAATAPFSNKADKWDALAGGLIFAAVGLYFWWAGRTNEVALENGKLFIGASRGQETLIDAIQSVTRRRFIFIFEIVSVSTLGGELYWPSKAEEDEVERALKIALKLRTPARTPANVAGNVVDEL